MIISWYTFVSQSRVYFYQILQWILRELSELNKGETGIWNSVANAYAVSTTGHVIPIVLIFPPIKKVSVSFFFFKDFIYLFIFID